MFMAEKYKHEKSVYTTDAKIIQLLQLFHKQMPIRYFFTDSNRSIVCLPHKRDTTNYLLKHLTTLLVTSYGDNQHNIQYNNLECQIYPEYLS